MARLGQLCVSIGLAFLVASSSVTACSSTDTPAAEPVSPTTAATTQISTDETEPTSEPSNLVKLCTALQSWGLVTGMLSLRPMENAISAMVSRDEEITVEEINEQLNERFGNSVVTVEVAPDAYMAILIETLSILVEVLDGSLSGELQEFAEAYSDFIAERVRTFDFDNPTVNISSMYLDDLPNLDIVIEECGYPVSGSDQAFGW